MKFEIEWGVPGVLINTLKRAEERAPYPDAAVLGNLVTCLEEQAPKPKPQEPLGLGAMATDRNDNHWARNGVGEWVYFDCPLEDGPDCYPWERFNEVWGPVTVVSQGIEV